MMEKVLKYKPFIRGEDLCKFVNDGKGTVEIVNIIGNTEAFLLFYYDLTVDNEDEDYVRKVSNWF